MGLENGVIGSIYLLCGILGLLGNAATFLTFVRYSEFHSSPYFWMTGIALADMLMCIVLGLYAGFRVLTGFTGGAGFEALVSCIDHAAWYIMLTLFNGLDANRFFVLCLRPAHPWAIQSQNKTMTLWAMVITSTVIIVFTIWLIVVPEHPQLNFVFYDQIYTFNYNTSTEAGMLGSRINVIYDAICLAVQFLSQSAVLWKVRRTRNRLARNRNFSFEDPNNCLVQKRAAAAQQQQVGIFFQCLGPNIVIILNTVAFFSVPSIAPYMSPWHVSLIHIFWLFQHSCNPLFYSMFNEQLRNRWCRIFRRRHSPVSSTYQLGSKTIKQTENHELKVLSPTSSHGIEFAVKNLHSETRSTLCSQ